MRLINATREEGELTAGFDDARSRVSIAAHDTRVLDLRGTAVIRGETDFSADAGAADAAALPALLNATYLPGAARGADAAEVAAAPAVCRKRTI